MKKPITHLKPSLGNNDKIYANEIVRYRRYNAPKPCDNSVAKVATRIFQRLKWHEAWFRELDISLVGRKQIAICLALYLEDYVVDAGIFKAFIAHNEEVLGKALPFYDLKDYDNEYINWQDVSFLCWIFVEYQKVVKFIPPDQPALIGMGKEIFDCMEEVMEDLEGTDDYDKIFTVADDEDFFELKLRMKFFGAQSYLQGLFGTFKYHDETQKILEESEMARKLEPEVLKKIFYAIEDDCFIYLRTQFSALNTIEWFAKVARCSEKMRQQILGIEGRLFGTFYLTETTEKHYIFKHIYTNRTFLVNKTSSTLSNSKSEKRAFKTTIVPWNEEWWISGISTENPMTNQEFEALKSKPEKFLPKFYDGKSKETLYESHEKMQEAFLAFFGTRLVICDNKRDLQSKMESYYEFQQVKGDDEFKERVRKFKEKHGQSNFDIVQESNNQLFLYFNPFTGIEILQNQYSFLQLLKSENPLSGKEKASIFEILFIGCPSCEMTQYILDNFPTHNLAYPYPLSKVNILKEKDFLMRYYAPTHFNESMPNILLTNLQ
jgi:hypothetical protein